MANDLKILDCTLRDGGYINDWKWGCRTARDIIHTLVKANVDIVEVGFLRSCFRRIAATRCSPVWRCAVIMTSTSSVRIPARALR